MSAESHRKMLKILRQALVRIDRIPDTSGNRKLRKPKPDFEIESITHDITVVVSSLWQFVKEVETGFRALETNEDNEELPVFSMMNNMLFNQKKFRDSITRIMSISYGYKSPDISKPKDPQIILLAQIIEALAVYIKRSRHEILLEEEIFSDTIALMKINRILQLKELKITELDIYQDFSVERRSDGTETNIANCLAAGDKTRDVQQLAAKELRKLRRIKADVSKLRVSFENFYLQFSNLLHTKLDFALFWKEALASKSFGYAVECYSEKCIRELKDFKLNVDDFRLVIEKLIEAEKLLIKLEEKAVAHPKFLKDVDSLDQAIKESLPLLTEMCIRVTGKRLEALIGEVNLRKYREMRLLVPVEKVKSDVKVSQMSRSKLFLKSIKGGERLGVSRVTKLTDLLGFGSHDPLKKGAQKRVRRQSCSHQDIVDEYEYTFSQTLAMLERGESSVG